MKSRLLGGYGGVEAQSKSEFSGKVQTVRLLILQTAGVHLYMHMLPPFRLPAPAHLAIFDKWFTRHFLSAYVHRNDFLHIFNESISPPAC